MNIYQVEFDDVEQIYIVDHGRDLADYLTEAQAWEAVTSVTLVRSNVNVTDLSRRKNKAKGAV